MKPIKRRYSYIFKDTALRLRITWEKCGVTLSTGYHIDREVKGKAKWDGRRCKLNTYHGKGKLPALTINKALDELEEKINQAFYHFESIEQVPSPAELKAMIRGNTALIKNYHHAFVEFLVEGSRINQWADNTIKSIKQVNNLVLKFDPGISFDKIDKEYMERFILYQQSLKLSAKKYQNGEPGYSNAVINKNCRVLGWFLKWAYEKGYVKYNIKEDNSVSLKTITKPIIFLTWDELMRIYNHPFELGSTLDKARDFFCFCSFTSLRYSDAFSLKRSQCHSGKIHLYSIKTNKEIVIELNKYSKAILDKYNDAPEYVLPRITNYQINQSIKEIGKIVQIDTPINYSQFYGSKKVLTAKPKYELLTSHCARRTFICNALSLGIAPNVVMKWTGHSEYSAMKPYIDIADEIKADAMSKFDTL